MPSRRSRPSKAIKFSEFRPALLVNSFFSSNHRHARLILAGSWIASGLLASASAANAQAESVPTLAPEAPQATVSGDNTLSSTENLLVKGFRFEGNTVFSDEELAKQLESFTNREVTADELEKARTSLTQFYIERGYINSGATLPDQDVANGIITFAITEGRITDFKLVGNRHFRPRYLKRQIVPDEKAPLNVLSIRDRLQLLRQNSNITSLNADVQPGSRPGEATLVVDVTETSPYGASLIFDNHRPPSVGGERLTLFLSNTNVTGLDDSLDVGLGLTEDDLKFSNPTDLRNLSLSYRSPVIASQTRLAGSYIKSDTAVIEEPFRSLNITSRSENYSLGLQKSLQHTLNRDSNLSLSLEHRKSASFLFGQPFSFSLGDKDGVSETTALRIGADYLRRDTGRVFASRILLSYGGDFGGSTDNPEPPNGRFLTVLGQLQHVQRLDDQGKRLILRFDGQWSNNPLLTVEKFAVGGANSVRGYRENQLVRDKGYSASAEARLPLIYDKTGRETLTLAPFFDFGGGKNLSAAQAGANEKNHISSLGVGLLYTDNKRLNAQIYYGYALQNIDDSRGDLQDKGIHFAINLGL